MDWRSELDHGLPERRGAAGRGRNPVVLKFEIADNSPLTGATVTRDRPIDQRVVPLPACLAPRRRMLGEQENDRALVEERFAAMTSQPNRAPDYAVHHKRPWSQSAPSMSSPT